MFLDLRRSISDRIAAKNGVRPIPMDERVIVMGANESGRDLVSIAIFSSSDRFLPMLRVLQLAH